MNDTREENIAELIRIGNLISERSHGELQDHTISPIHGRSYLAIVIPKKARRKGETMENAVRRIVADNRLMNKLVVVGLDTVRSAVEYRLRG